MNKLQEQWDGYYTYTPNEKLGKEAISKWWLSELHSELWTLRESVRKMKPAIIGNPEMTLGIEDQVKLRTLNAVESLITTTLTEYE